MSRLGVGTTILSPVCYPEKRNGRCMQDLTSEGKVKKESDFVSSSPVQMNDNAWTSVELPQVSGTLPKSNEAFVLEAESRKESLRRKRQAENEQSQEEHLHRVKRRASAEKDKAWNKLSTNGTTAVNSSLLGINKRREVVTKKKRSRKKSKVQPKSSQKSVRNGQLKKEKEEELAKKECNKTRKSLGKVEKRSRGLKVKKEKRKGRKDDKVRLQEMNGTKNFKEARKIISRTTETKPGCTTEINMTELEIFVNETARQIYKKMAARRKKKEKKKDDDDDDDDDMMMW
ncbi:hypothetical protein WDU94_002749 [Cyamophila willieti]